MSNCLTDYEGVLISVLFQKRGQFLLDYDSYHISSSPVLANKTHIMLYSSSFGTSHNGSI